MTNRANQNWPVDEVIEVAAEFSVGDMVTFTNDYGVTFPHKTIIEVKPFEGKVLYYFAPTDTPWMHHYAHQLSKEN